MTPPPRVPGGMAKSNKFCLLFTYSICYLEVNRNFLGEREFSAGHFPRWEFQMDRKFPKMIWQERILHGGIRQNLYTKFVLLSLCRFHFTSKDVPGKFSEVKISGDFFFRERQGFPTGKFPTRKFSVRKTLHGEIFSTRNSPWWKFSTGENLHRRIFRGKNFPVGGWIYQENFSSKGLSGVIWKKD
jgi:hypothetical protein